MSSVSTNHFSVYRLNNNKINTTIGHVLVNLSSLKILDLAKRKSITWIKSRFASLFVHVFFIALAYTLTKCDCRSELVELLIEFICSNEKICEFGMPFLPATPRGS